MSVWGFRARRPMLLPRLRRARFGMQLAVALLVLNAFSPTLAETLTTRTGPSPQEAYTDLSAGRMVICTPTGLRVITLDENGKPQTDAADTAYEGICPFCPPLSSVGGGAVPLLAAELPAPRAALPREENTRSVECVQPRLALWQRPVPRGPPSVV